MSLDRLTVICLMCALSFVGTAQPFQQKDTAQPMVIRVNVDLVQVDATVTNSSDEPVTNLQAEDFIILQDDKPQEITNFSFIRIRDAAARPPVIKKTSEELQKNVSLPAPPPVPIKREKVRRAIALVVDDLGLSYESMGFVRHSIKKWVDEEMLPNDLVALVLTGKGEGVLQQFTNDKRLLYAAIDSRINYNAASRVGVTSLSGLSGGDPAQEERNLAYTKFTMQSIQDTINGLKDLPGRKDLILFSESMDVMFRDNTNGLSQGRDLHMKEMLQRTVDAANKSAVVIHSIDPRGVMVFTSAEQTLSSDGSGPDWGQLASQLNSSRDGMARLVQDTGGLFVHDQNNIDKALEKVVDDGDGYYLIGYQPDQATITEMKSGNAKYHKIRVRVKRSGLRVRSRSRFFSTPEDISPPNLMVRKERVEDALRSPFASGSLKVRLTALFSQTKEEKPCINALIHFDISRLEFSLEPGGWRKASLEFVAGLYDSSGQQVEFGDRAWRLQLKGQSYEDMKRNGASFLMRLPVREAGAYQMRLVLRDSKSGRLGSASQFIEIPDVRKNKLTLSGIVLAGDQTKVKGPEEQIEGMMEDSGANGTPAVRVFEPGVAISWAYQILNAKNDEDQSPKLQMQYRLFHEGQEIFAKKPIEMTVAAKGNSKRMIAADQLKLTQLPPGYYILQIAVTDMLADKKDRMAVQSIDFEVQNPRRPSEN
jgi:VWFA-related protein